DRGHVRGGTGAAGAAFGPRRNHPAAMAARACPAATRSRRRAHRPHSHSQAFDNTMTTDTPADRIIGNVPDGMQPIVLARLIEERVQADPAARVAAVFVARDGRRLQRMAEILAQLMPGHTILTLPAWDCLPYDRVSPNAVTIAARMTTLAALTDERTKGAIVLTAVNALVQKLPPRDVVAGMSFSARA